MTNVNKEIEVVENIIRLLNECLAISLKNKKKEESKKTLIDIRNCEMELKRLVGIRAAKEAAIAAKDGAEETKEPTKGNAAV